MMTAQINMNSVRNRCVTGFVLALLLTLMAFGLIGMSQSVSPGLFAELARNAPWIRQFIGVIGKNYALAGVYLLAILQILVHMRYFLHLNFAASQRPKTLVLLFTLLILLIMVGGSYWVMSDLDRMME